MKDISGSNCIYHHIIHVSNNYWSHSRQSFIHGKSLRFIKHSKVCGCISISLRLSIYFSDQGIVIESSLLIYLDQVMISSACYKLGSCCNKIVR